MWDLRSDVREPTDDLVYMPIRRNVSGVIQGRVEGILLSRTHEREGQYTRVGRLDLRLGEDHELAVDDGKI